MLTSPALAPLGVCVSPSIVLLNHSRDSNAVAVFPRSTKGPTSQEPEAHFVAIRDISPGEEEDLHVVRRYDSASGSEAGSPLCHIQLFVPVCCSEPPEPDPREAVACPKDCGVACPFPLEGPSYCRLDCKSAVASTDEVLDALRVGQEALQKVTHLQFSGLNGVLPPGHPTRALALAEPSKLLAVDEPSPAPRPPVMAATTAAATFPPSGPARLRDELLIRFGERNGGGEVGHEVREMVVRVERELAAWDQGIRNVI